MKTPLHENREIARSGNGLLLSPSPLKAEGACTKTQNAGMPERRTTKTWNTKLLKPGTHEK